MARTRGGPTFARNSRGNIGSRGAHAAHGRGIPRYLPSTTFVPYQPQPEEPNSSPSEVEVSDEAYVELEDASHFSSPVQSPNLNTQFGNLMWDPTARNYYEGQPGYVSQMPQSLASILESDASAQTTSRSVSQDLPIVHRARSIPIGEVRRAADQIANCRGPQMYPNFAGYASSNQNIAGPGAIPQPLQAQQFSEFQMAGAGASDAYMLPPSQRHPISVSIPSSSSGSRQQLGYPRAGSHFDHTVSGSNAYQRPDWYQLASYPHNSASGQGPVAFSFDPYNSQYAISGDGLSYQIPTYYGHHSVGSGSSNTDHVRIENYPRNYFDPTRLPSTDPSSMQFGQMPAQVRQQTMWNGGEGSSNPYNNYMRRMAFSRVLQARPQGSNVPNSNVSGFCTDGSSAPLQHGNRKMPHNTSRSAHRRGSVYSRTNLEHIHAEGCGCAGHFNQVGTKCGLCNVDLGLEKCGAPPGADPPRVAVFPCHHCYHLECVAEIYAGEDGLSCIQCGKDGRS